MFETTRQIVLMLLAAAGVLASFSEANAGRRCRGGSTCCVYSCPYTCPPVVTYACPPVVTYLPVATAPVYGDPVKYASLNGPTISGTCYDANNPSSSLSGVAVVVMATIVSGGSLTQINDPNATGAVTTSSSTGTYSIPGTGGYVATPIDGQFYINFTRAGGTTKQYGPFSWIATNHKINPLVP